MVVDGRLKLVVLLVLPLFCSVEHLRDELKVALGIDKPLNGPVNFVLGQLLIAFKCQLAECRTLQIGPLAHDRSNMQVARQSLAQRQRRCYCIVLIIRSGLAVCRMICICLLATAVGHSVAELLVLSGLALLVQCQYEYLAQHLLEVLFDDTEILLANLVEWDELFQDLSFSIFALFLSHLQI